MEGYYIKRIKTLLSVFLFPLILLFGFISVTKAATSTIKNITLKKVDIDVTKNRSVPIKITIGDKIYNTNVKTSSLRHAYWKNIKIKDQYSTGKNSNLKGFIGYKLL